MSRRVYLDHAASSPLRAEVRAAMLAALELTGNASSVHAEGRALRAALEAARREIAGRLGADPDGIVFTSGATEANAGALAAGGPILASAVEHPSVLAQPGVEPLPVDTAGRLELVALEERLSRGGIGRVALMLANNETGVLQPVAEAAALARRFAVPLHVDAVQALGKLPVDVRALGADSVALSAHKIGGPPGVGLLWQREPDATSPLLRGGGQEWGRRAGTENAAGIRGFAAALAATGPAEAERLRGLRERLESEACRLVDDAVVVAAGAARLPHIAALALPGVPAAAQVMALDLAGIAVSAGAACSSGRVAASHVLEAMRLDPAIAAATIRVSLGWSSGEADIDRFLEVWSGLARRRAAGRSGSRVDGVVASAIATT